MTGRGVRVEPQGLQLEDADTARVVARIQAGDAELFSVLYLRYFDRVYSYLRLLVGDDAEDAAQSIFVKAMEALPRYEQREQPFRAWLFTIVRNHSLNVLRDRGRCEPTDPHEVARWRESEGADELAQLTALGWITDDELLMFVERLPLPQRQVLMLRYMLDLPHEEIAAVLHRDKGDIRSLHSRAVRFLRARLEAVGGDSRDRQSASMYAPLKHLPVLRHRRWSLSP